MNALRRAGVFVLDMACDACDDVVSHPAIASHVGPASGAGALDALTAAVAAATAMAGGKYVPVDFLRDEAAALRHFLLQHRWFGSRARSGREGDAGSPSRLATLRSLRVFELYPEVSSLMTTGGDNGGKRWQNDGGGGVPGTMGKQYGGSGATAGEPTAEVGTERKLGGTAVYFRRNAPPPPPMLVVVAAVVPRVLVARRRRRY